MWVFCWVEMVGENGKKGEMKVIEDVVLEMEGILGYYIVCWFVEIGVCDVFIVFGDFNLVLFDYLIVEFKLRFVGCCNELNVGYVVDGYVWVYGVGVCVVIFIVGGLSVINVIVGVYSENLFIICIVGGLNLNDFGMNWIIYYMIGELDFG